LRGLVLRTEAEGRGLDGRGLLVARSNNLEEETGLFTPEPRIADLVADQQALTDQSAIGLQSPVTLRGLGLQDQVGSGDELGVDPSAATL
jgi:hypothetical protein